MEKVTCVQVENALDENQLAQLTHLDNQGESLV